MSAKKSNTPCATKENDDVEPLDALAQRLLAAEPAKQDAGVLIFRRIASFEARQESLEQIVRVWARMNTERQRQRIRQVICRLGPKVIEGLYYALSRASLPADTVPFITLLVSISPRHNELAKLMDRVARHPQATATVREAAQAARLELQEAPNLKK